jgi:hypothetical protein
MTILDEFGEGATGSRDAERVGRDARRWGV